MTYDREQWASIDGYEASYEVSSHGGIRSLDRQVRYSDGRVAEISGRVLRPAVDKNGYRAITLPGGKRQYLHRLVAMAFLPQPVDARTVNHLDGDKLNNRVDNLEWVTYRENNVHARATGLNRQHGEHCNLSKWSEQCVNAVHRLKATGKLTQREIASCLGVSEGFVSNVITGRSRRH